MNKNIFCLSIGLCVCAGPYPVMAQKASSDTATVPATKEKRIEVKDYKSFKEYVAREKAYLKTKPVTTDNGPIRTKMAEMGVAFSPRSLYSLAKDKKSVAYQARNKKGIALVDKETKHVSLYHADGRLFETVSFLEMPDGAVDFSDNRLFMIKACFRGSSGFEIYDFKGLLIKRIENGCVENYLVSNSGKYFITIAGSRQGHYLTAYDMSGETLFRSELPYGDAEIVFSGDDRYALVRIPVYWKNYEKELFEKKGAYTFDIMKKQMISEDRYEE